MAVNINTEIEIIRNAAYAREVRDAIADGLEHAGIAAESISTSEMDVNTVSLWESGQINSDGTNNTNNTRIRTIGYIPDNVVRVKTDGQANVRAQLYAEDGTFVKVSALGFTQDFMVADVLAENEQAAKIRLTIQHIKG